MKDKQEQQERPLTNYERRCIREFGTTRRGMTRYQAKYDRRRGYDLDDEGNSLRDRD